MGGMNIVYHCFCHGGWKEIVQDQFRHFKGATITSTVIGDALQISELKRIAKLFDIVLHVNCFEDPLIYEHQAMLKIEEICASDQNGYTLYFHSKGAGNSNEYSKPWREYLNRNILEEHEKLLDQLVKSGKDVTGVFYAIKRFDRPFKWRTTRFFAGNYWIVANSYFSKLPDYSYLKKKYRNSRFLPERYIGWNDPRVHFIDQDRISSVKGVDGIVSKIKSLKYHSSK